MNVIFFFQAEDGIRDVAVTGVQTCALPIFPLQNFLHFLAAHRKGTWLAVSGPSEEGGTLAAVSPQELYGLLRQVHIPLAARQFGGGYKALVAPREFPLRQGLPTQQQEPRLGWPTLR